MKRALSVVLALCLTLTLCVTAPMSRAEAAAGGFTDISDPAVREAAEFLAALDIMIGTGTGTFSPNGSLNRAMLAVIGTKLAGVMDVSAYTGSVRFPDVRANHWGHGWIMAAVQNGVMSGNSDGTFAPDGPMEFRYVATVLVKLLGYTDKMLGGSWPTNYINKAESLGLCGQMRFAPREELTRGEMALMVYNLLFLPNVDGNTFLGEMKNITVSSGVLQLQSFGGSQLVMDSAGGLSPVIGTLDSSLEGRYGSIVKNTGGSVLAFLPDASLSYVSVIVSEAKTAGVETTGAGSYAIRSAATVYQKEAAATSYTQAYPTILKGESLLLALTEYGTVDYVYRQGAAGSGSGVSVVLEQDFSANPLSSLFGTAAAGATIAKNGVATTWQTLERWDVLTYYADRNHVVAVNTHFPAYLTSIGPNLFAPDHVMVLDTKLSLSDSVRSKIAGYQTGLRYWFFVDHNGVLVDIRSSVAVSTQSSPVLVEPGQLVFGSGFTLEGNVSYTGPTSLFGQVSYTLNTQSDLLLASAIDYTAATADINLAAMTMGGTPVASWCAVYERAGSGGAFRRVELDELPVSLIARARVVHAGVGACGYVTTLLIEDVTNDAYSYGFLQTGEQSFPMSVFSPLTLDAAWLTDGLAQISEYMIVRDGLTLPRDNTVVGLAFGYDANAHPTVTQVMTLPTHTGIGAYAFNGTDSVLIGDRAVPLDTDSVYVPSLGMQLTLSEARSYCQSFTLYTDTLGYKVRFIVGY